MARPVWCGSWHCEECAEHKRAKLIAEAILGQPTTFLTLTTNPNIEPDPDRASDMLLDAWQRWLRQTRHNRPGDDIQALKVWEATKNGMPHLHVLLRAPYLDQREISAFMAAQIGAPIVDIRAVTSASQVAGYVAKYIGKAPSQFANHHRHDRTRRWLNTSAYRKWLAHHTVKYQWQLLHVSLDDLALRLQPHAHTRRDRDTLFATTHDPPRAGPITNRGPTGPRLCGNDSGGIPVSVPQTHSSHSVSQNHADYSSHCQTSRTGVSDVR